MAKPNKSRKGRHLYKKTLSLLISFLLFITPITSVFALSVSYSYDPNGNLVSDGTHCYTYNDANQLTKVIDCSSNQTIAEYWYDHQGKRGKKNHYEDGILQYTIYYIGDFFETKLYPNGTTENTSYYFLNGERVARKDPDGSMHYIHGDHLGSADVVTDSTGNLEEKTQYYPYGKIIAGGNQSKYLYTGQEKDEETGLYYYGARYYNPELMRFVQADLVIPALYNPQALNRYSYVQNNPVKYVDPEGENPVYFMVAGVFMGVGYIGGSAWGVGEHAVNTGTYNPVELFNSREAQELSAERGTEGAVLGAAVAVALITESWANLKSTPKTTPAYNTPKEGFSVVPRWAGQSFRTSGEVLTKTNQLTEGTDHIFAESMQGVTKIGTRETVGSHADFFAGSNVRTAGHIQVKDGVYHISPATGHYQVSQESINYAKDYLVNLGVDASKIVIHSFKEYYGNGGVLV